MWTGEIQSEQLLIPASYAPVQTPRKTVFIFYN